MKSSRAVSAFVIGALVVSSCSSPADDARSTDVSNSATGPTTSVGSTGTSGPERSLTDTPATTAVAFAASDLSAILDGFPAVAGSPGELLHVTSRSRGVDVGASRGVADLATEKPLEVDATVRLASVTKVYTAAAVLRLAEQGVIDLDDDIATGGVSLELVSMLADDGYVVDEITVRQLIGHASGVADYAQGYSEGPYGAAILAEPGRVWTREEQVGFAMDNFDPLAIPGTEFHYSDTGYVLLGDLLEQRTGSTFAQALRDLLGFDELGLDATWLELVETPPVAAGLRAAQYVGSLDAAQVSPTFDLFGGGGLVGSMADVAHFFDALVGGEVFDDPDTFEVMATLAGPSVDAGLGIYSAETAQGTCWYHDGFFGAIAFTCPDADVTIAYSWNQAVAEPDVDELMQSVLDAVAPVEPRPSSVTATAQSAEAFLAARPATVASETCPTNLPEGAECGNAVVPLDWADADSESLTIWFARVPASVQPATGTLIPLTGGPGGSISTFAEVFTPFAAGLPDQDLLIVDVRGVGRSSRLACAAIDAADVIQIGERQADVVGECAEQLGSRRDHFATTSIVLDLEAIRRALDLPDPSLLGFSYGTWVASVYSIMFPDVVRAAVLDGAFPLLGDPWGANVPHTFDTVLALVCARTAGCSARQAALDFRTVAIALRSDPQPIPGWDQPLTEGVLVGLTPFLLQAMSVDFISAVGDAAEGDYTALAALAPALWTIPAAGTFGDSYGQGAAVFCNDYGRPYDPNGTFGERRIEFEAGLESLPAEAFGWFSPRGWIDNVWVQDLCLEWPNSSMADELALPVDGPFPDTPVLVINGDLDLQTTMNEARQATAQFPNSVLLEIRNAGHGVTLASPCALATAFTFLDDLQLPSTDVCDSEQLANPGA